MIELAILLICGLIPASIAVFYKKRSFWLWWLYGTLLFPVAVLHIFLKSKKTPFTPLDSNSPRNYENSEMADCPVCNYHGMAGVVGRYSPGGVVLWVFAILLIFCPIGWILLALKLMNSSNIVECPKCLATFHDDGVNIFTKPTITVMTRGN